MEPTEKKYYLIVATVAVIVVSVIVGLFYWQLNRESPTSPDSYSIPTQNPTDIDKEKSIASIYEISKIPKPTDVETENEIAFSALPEEVAELINASRSSVTIKIVTYVDGSAGYKITYQIPGVIYKNQTYYLDLRHSNWTIINFLHSEVNGLVKLQKDKFDVLVEQSVLDESNLNVIVTIIEKP